MTELEASLQSRVISTLTLYLGNGARGYVDRRDAGAVSRRYRQKRAAGTPDLQVVLAHGLICWIELKRPGRATKKRADQEAQAAWQARARRLGHKFVVADSVEGAIAFVRRVESGAPCKQASKLVS